MKKGLIALFAAVALWGANSAFAFAPVVSNLPDITVGDAEDNGPTDNNYFVFTNAFKFDSSVNDKSVAESTLLWSFDEGDPVDTSASATQQWYTVNGKGPVHVGDAAMAGTEAAHVAPGGNEVRQGSNGYASFRDIIFTPGTAQLPPGYPDPTATYGAAAVSAHNQGKVVQFFVSDGTTVTASNKIIVNTVDNGNDAVSGGSKFEPMIREKCTTATSWIYSGQSASSSLGPGMGNDWDSVNQALRLRCFTASTDSAGVAVRNRIGGWYALEAPDVLLYSSIGAGKVVRAKFYLYATGQANPNATNRNQVPAFQLRLSTGYQITMNLEVTPHLNSIPGDEAKYAELNPSADPTNPSVYRVDLDPIETPYLTNNPNTLGLATRPAFSIQALDPQDNGYIAMSECVLGTYDSSLVPDTKAPMKTYQVADMDPAVSEQVVRENAIIGTVEGSNGTVQLCPPFGTYTGTDVPTVTFAAGVGVTHNTSAVPNSKIGVSIQYFSANRAGQLSQAQIARINPDSQYKIRFHITSTQTTNRQPAAWLYARTDGFGYAQELEFAGFHVDGSVTNWDDVYGGEVLPGVGTQISDGWYTNTLYSPLSADMHPGKTIAQGFPFLSTQPGFGVDAGSFRDIGTGFFVIDSFNYPIPGGDTEQGIFTVDQIQVIEYPAVGD